LTKHSLASTNEVRAAAWNPTKKAAAKDTATYLPGIPASIEVDREEKARGSEERAAISSEAQ
jgi:hypothetical protein